MINKKQQFSNALERFIEVLGQPKNSFMRDSAIQRFEFCVDLVWKSLQQMLQSEHGLRPNSPKETIRMAYENKLISEPESWLSMIDDRNLTSHTYDENLAEEIYARLPGYLRLLRTLGY